MNISFRIWQRTPRPQTDSRLGCHNISHVFCESFCCQNLALAGGLRARKGYQFWTIELNACGNKKHVAFQGNSDSQFNLAAVICCDQQDAAALLCFKPHPAQVNDNELLRYTVFTANRNKRLWSSFCRNALMSNARSIITLTNHCDFSFPRMPLKFLKKCSLTVPLTSRSIISQGVLASSTTSAAHEKKLPKCLSPPPPHIQT